MFSRRPQSFAKLPLLLLSFALALVFSAVQILPAQAAGMSRFVQTAENFIILFDVSGSMAEGYPPSKGSKLEAATDLLRNMNREIPDFKYKAALLTFTPWKEYYPLKDYNKESFGKAIETLPKTVDGGQAFGAPTPLGEAMRGLGGMLKTLSGRTVVFLFSDGRNTDKLDPIRLAQQLAEKYKVCFMVVSLAKYPEGKAMLKAISEVSPCSTMMDFDYATRNPEVCTGQLCALAPFTEIFAAEKVESATVPVTAILFDFDKFDLKPAATQMLDKAVVEMQEKPQAVFYGSGFADSTGGETYNVGLSMRRAMATKDYLMAKGIAAERVVVRWYGESDPAATNATEEGRSHNRRVEFAVVPRR